MSLADKIKQRRLELNMSQDELARKLGYKSRSTVNKIEAGINDITQTKIMAFAKALDTTPAYLMGWEDEENNNEEDTIDLTKYGIKPVKTQKIPLLGNIACGIASYADEEFEGYIEASSSIHADFCLRANGDSMIGARILNGDVVFIQKTDMVQDGEIAAVIIDDNATLKRVYYDRANNIIRLVAENPHIPTQIYQGEQLNQIHILGKAVAFQSDVK